MSPTVRCPNGHTSGSDDFCDRCGLPVGPVADPGQSLRRPGSCPRCDAAWFPGDLFCEGCGHGLPDPAPGVWTAVVHADRAYHVVAGIPNVAFPVEYPARIYRLTGAEVRIGRRGSGGSAALEIDLSGAPQDTGISHRHAVLRRGSDGGWTVTDLGSRNGTTLNDDNVPLEPGRPTALTDRDRIHLGAWTTIVFTAPAGTPHPGPDPADRGSQQAVRDRRRMPGPLG